MRLGADVVHKGNAKVHVSGHASAGELLYCYNIVKPRNVMPVHGEWRHLVANADLAVKTGVPRRPGRAGRGRRGRRPRRWRGAASSAPCRAGTCTSTAHLSGRPPRRLLKDRRILRDEGFITIIVVRRRGHRQGRRRAEIQARGFAEDQDVFDQVLPRLEQALAEAASNGVTDSFQLQQIIRRTVGSWVGSRLRRRPMIIPIVIDA